MGVEKQPLPDEFEKTATLYNKALSAQLLDAKDPDAPVLKEFSAWVSKISGLKTLEDIKDDNNLEYYAFLFLMEHNIIFRLTVQNRLDLLLEFLTALTTHLTHGAR
jgi:hypothetical protein